MFPSNRSDEFPPQLPIGIACHSSCFYSPRHAWQRLEKVARFQGCINSAFCATVASTMYRYDGCLIAEYQDDQGPIEVVDRSGVRCMHFGTASEQSRLALADPSRLTALYEQAMTAFLLFTPAPASTLMIGLGGGSLARFLLQHSEYGRIHVVELRPQVVEVARTHFGLPQDPRLQISTGCGAQYVASQCRQSCGSHDVIIVDAYRGDGMAPEVASTEFFANCHALLAGEGMLVINLWRSNKAMLASVTRMLANEFNWRVHFIPMHGVGNFIGFAFTKGFPLQQVKQLESRALQMQQRYRLDYPVYLQDIRVSDPLSTLFADE